MMLVHKLFTVKIHQKVYTPMIGKVMYGKDEVGVPLVTDEETHAEMGWNYTVASPLSPYVLGTPKWKLLCSMKKDGEGLDDVFRAEINWKKNEVTVYKK
jgi:hypothetical protein